MPYITREDGEHFVIPSYRDVLVERSKNTLKNNILALSKDYGEYITLQKKGPFQYEVAFSNDSGYLLGESIWFALKKPTDLIYCEAVPNTFEAILVVVKSGAVYVDGRFPFDGIAEELVILRTEDNRFDVCVYGDVPICQTPNDDTFSLDEKNVKSFRVLEKPIFSTLRPSKTFQLQLVEPVLKSQGIGVLPIKQLIGVIVALGLGWMLWTSLYEVPEVAPAAVPVNPYQNYYEELKSPNTLSLFSAITEKLSFLATMPGWSAETIKYANGKINIKVNSYGGTMTDLLNWTNKHKLKLNITSSDIGFEISIAASKRPSYTMIYPLNEVIAKLVDTLGIVIRKNVMQLSNPVDMGSFNQVKAAITLENADPIILLFIGEQLKDLPIVLESIELNVKNGDTGITGIITLNLLGN